MKTSTSCYLTFLICPSSWAVDESIQCQRCFFGFPSSVTCSPESIQFLEPTDASQPLTVQGSSNSIYDSYKSPNTMISPKHARFPYGFAVNRPDRPTHADAPRHSMDPHTLGLLAHLARGGCQGLSTEPEDMVGVLGTDVPTDCSQCQKMYELNKRNPAGCNMGDAHIFPITVSGSPLTCFFWDEQFGSPLLSDRTSFGVGR